MSARAQARFTVLPGGRPAGSSSGPLLARGILRLVPGGEGQQIPGALAEAVEAARQIRLEIERRIARALEAFEDRG
jgi:hypothetical protein